MIFNQKHRMKFSTLRAALTLITTITLFVLLSCSQSNPEAPASKEKDYRGENIQKEKDFYKIEYKADFVLAYVLDSCQHLENFTLHEEDFVKVTPKMYQLIKFGNFKNTCSIVKDQLGLIKDKKLQEAFYSNGRLLKTFRYKIEAEKYDKPIELRLVFTDQNKLTEFRFFEWSDTYKPDLIKMNWF